MKYLLAAVLGLSLSLTGCGGGGDDAATLVAAEDVVVPLSPTVASALVNDPFVLGSGVAGLGTTGATTIVFTSAGATPAFSITADGNTASGTTTFGSCIFAVSQSTFPAGHPLANGQTVTLDPCDVRIRTAGALANGEPVSRSLALLLGAVASGGTSASVGVDAGGNVVLNGTAVTTVKLTYVTGGGS